MKLCLPTPMHRLDRAFPNNDVWIKRDDLTGFALGGNKTRKAAKLLEDAEGSDVLLTVGDTQSNHARVIAACAAQKGIECELFLTGPNPGRATSNLLLDRLAGASVRFIDDPDQREAAMNQRASELRIAGKKPYAIPLGGSNAIGASAFVEAAKEIDATDPATVVLASSSGGTYAGLMKGFEDSPIKLIGIRVDRDPDPEKRICEIVEGFDPSDVNLNSGFVGEDYAVPTPEGMAAIRLLWQKEGVLLDPVYTGKAMAGLISLLERGELSGRIIFWHTGGTPSVFRYSATDLGVDDL